MKRSRQESGFALLLVFLMAAVIAISLYMEIPRVAFEAQRQKEQLLIDRGEQYKRAIQVFYTTNKRYPARIEELESLNGRRFLRRRYLDPMTGKDEWRLVHIQNGMLTDSVDSKQKKTDDKDKSGNSGQYVAELGGLAPANQNGQNSTNPANRRRSSEGGGTSGSSGDLSLNTGATGTPGVTGMPSIPGIPGVPGGSGAIGTPSTGNTQNPGGGYTGSTGTTGTTTSGSGNNGGSGYIGGGYSLGGSSSTTTTGTSGTGTTTGAGNVPPGAPPGFPGAGAMPLGGGVQQPGMNPAAQNAAAAMIQQILTQPRPGGMPTGNAGMMGNGIAGVASKADEDSIMVYNNHTNYGDWEYIFDFTKYRPPPNPLVGSQGTPASQMGNMPRGTVGTPVGQQPGSSFGQQPGGFGTTPTTPTTQQQ